MRLRGPARYNSAASWPSSSGPEGGEWTSIAIVTVAPVRLDRPRPRELTILHPSLAARYTSVVAAVASRVEAGLSDAVAANRVSAAAVDPPVLRLRSFARERAAFHRELVALAERGPCLLLTDVRACFPSIGPTAVEAALRAFGCERGAVAAVVRTLRRLRALGVPGLPIGPDASAVLANAVLSVGDRQLEASGLPHLRWVDDLVVAVRDGAEAGRALARLRRALATAGLELNDAKTRVARAAGPLVLPGSLGRSLAWAEGPERVR